ncbi:MAG: TIGR00266 family protein [Actinomycetota bacterium]
MQVDIQSGPAFAFGTITLPPGGSVEVEAGAMAAMSGGVEIATASRGGMLGGLKRSVLGGESFFINTFTSAAGGSVSVAAKLPGDMVHMPLDGTRPMMVQSGSWIASDPAVDVDTKWGGAKTFFSGEGLFLLRCTGQGDMLVSSYGALIEREIEAGATYTIDTGHIVAFPEGMKYEVHKAGNWKSTLLGAEGLVTEFTGPGKVWLQTRSPQDLLGWLTANMPGNRS